MVILHLFSAVAVVEVSAIDAQPDIIKSVADAIVDSERIGFMLFPGPPVCSSRYIGMLTPKSIHFH